MLPQTVAGLFRNSSSFLQWQMDINPKSPWYRDAFIAASGGYFVATDPAKRIVMDLDPADTVRRDMLILQLRSIHERNIAGDLAELGVYRGATARLFHHYLPERVLHLFDTFEGFSETDLASEKQRTALEVDPKEFRDTGVELAAQVIDAKNGNVRFYPGHFPASADGQLTGRQFAFVHLDADLYESTLAGLNYFYDRVTTGGIIVVHDYNAWLGARTAVNEFFANKREIPIPMPDKSGSVVIIKG